MGLYYSVLDSQEGLDAQTKISLTIFGESSVDIDQQLEKLVKSLSSEDSFGQYCLKRRIEEGRIPDSSLELSILKFQSYEVSLTKSQLISLKVHNDWLDRSEWKNKTGLEAGRAAEHARLLERDGYGDIYRVDESSGRRTGTKKHPTGGHDIPLKHPLDQWTPEV